MDREKAIKLLDLDLNGYKALYETERNLMERKYLRNKIEAFEYAINELEEVTNKRKEKDLLTLETFNGELNINLSQKQYEEMAILDFCTPKYTAYEILKLLKILSVI